MPNIQTSYGDTMRPAIAGMIADMSPRSLISRIVETAVMGFGVVAVQGAGAKAVKPAAAGAAFIGITVMDPTIVHVTPPGTVDAYPVGDVALVMIQGTVWVVAGATVAAGDPAYFVPATGVITNVATNNTLIPNARFDTGAASGALVKLRMI